MTEPAHSAPPPRRKLLIDALVIAALIALGIAGYQLAPLLKPRSDVALPLSACDIGKTPCVIALPDGGTLEVAIGPRPIPALKPLQLQAIARGGKVRGVEIDFAGVDMKMGINRPRLQEQGGGHFTGEASLPVCITGTMQWEATVIVDTAGALIAAPFRFVSEGS